MFKLLNPPPKKFASLIFWVLMETEYQCQPLWKKLKNGCLFCKYVLCRKCSNYWTHPQKVWISDFLSIDGNRISVSVILKNWKYFVNVCCTETFQITTPPQKKFDSLVFLVLTVTEYWSWPLWKNKKMATIS